MTDPEGCGHEPLSGEQAVRMLNLLYGSGYGYHEIADLTTLNLTHQQTRDFVIHALGGPGSQTTYLGRLK